MGTISPNADVAAEAKNPPSLVRGLSLLDSVLLLVSGVIGSAVFLTAKDVAGPLPNPVLFLLVWILGGLISLLACFAFAELGSMFPQAGGQYVYLREAYGPLTAFLYGWMIFAVSNGGTIAALAVASAAYLGKIIPDVSQAHAILSVHGMVFTRAHMVALVSIAFVTSVNVLGLRRGALLQNLATWAKFAAMAAFVLLGITMGKGDWRHLTANEFWTVNNLGSIHLGHLLSAFGVALIAVFWAYDGWVYITWVAGWRTPAFSLVGQGIWASILAISGRYDQLYTYVMFGMVLSYTLTVIGMFVLRRTRPELVRPYRCAGYPWLPAIYVAIGIAWTLNTIDSRPLEALTGTFIVMLGLPGYLYWKRTNSKRPGVESV